MVLPSQNLVKISGIRTISWTLIPPTIVNGHFCFNDVKSSYLNKIPLCLLLKHHACTPTSFSKDKLFLKSSGDIPFTSRLN